MTASGADQNSGVKQLNSLDGNTREMQEECLELCRAEVGATGCEVIWDRSSRGCYVHTEDVARGNGYDNYQCWVFSSCIIKGRNITELQI